MRWHLSHRFDPRALRLADQHYSRQKPGTTQFVRPGRCLVLLTACERALWVSSWQFPEFEHHEWPGTQQCALFRNTGAGLSSNLIREAIAATRAVWGEPPPPGFVTFVDPAKVRPKTDPGYCFLKAGFEILGETASGKLALVLRPELMPEPCRARQMTVSGLPLFSVCRTNGALARSLVSGGVVNRSVFNQEQHNGMSFSSIADNMRLEQLSCHQTRVAELFTESKQ